MKKILIMISLLLTIVSITSCKGFDNKSDKKRKTKIVKNTAEENVKDEILIKLSESLPKGEDKPYSTDGKLHEEKFLDKVYSYPDTADSFKISKKGNEYFVTDYIGDPDGQSEEIKEEKSKLKIYKNVALLNEDGTILYAYDTKLQKLVFLNGNFRIFMETYELED